MRDTIERRLQELAKRAGMRDMPPGVVAAVLVLAAIAVIWAAWRWWPGGVAAASSERSAPDAADTVSEAGEDAPVAESLAPEPSVAAAASETSLVVHVAGEVRHPGVYHLAAGARVVDAVESAGGLLGNAAGDALNLARQVTDGEQIVVPSTDAVANGTAQAGSVPAPVGSAGSAPQAGAPVNINTADEAALDTLPGVGPSTAQKIIADREQNGAFASPEDLGRVSGIGPKRLESLKDLICVR